MRILFVNRFFGDDQTPTGRMLGDVAEMLTQEGHDVVILASNGGYSGRQNQTSETSPFRIIQIPTFQFFPRVVSWLWFLIASFFCVSFIRAERCVLLTDPPFMPLLVWFWKMLGVKKDFYWWTMDLYPEALSAAGMMNSQTSVYRFLHECNELGLKSMRGVITLGSRQLLRLKKYRHFKSTPDFTLIAPPWDNRPIPFIEADDNVVIKRLGWKDFKIALYAGNLGEGHLHDEILSAARWFHDQNRQDWLFVFAIRGSGKAEVEAAAKSLSNLCVLNYLSPEETSHLLNSANVHLITMKSGWEGVIVPSKLYGCLKTKRPVLFIGPEDADTAQEIVRKQRGIVLPPFSKGENVAKVLDQLACNPLNSTLADDQTIYQISQFLAHE